MRVLMMSLLAGVIATLVVVRFSRRRQGGRKIGRTVLADGGAFGSGDDAGGHHALGAGDDSGGGDGGDGGGGE
jgi:hypothetical protein